MFLEVSADSYSSGSDYKLVQVGGLYEGKPGGKKTLVATTRGLEEELHLGNPAELK